MMKTNRRAFLSTLAAATSIPVVGFATQLSIDHLSSETQEEKCIRLTKELLAELAKLPVHGKSRGGPYVELRNGADISTLRYVQGNDGVSSLIAMIDLGEAA